MNSDFFVWGWVVWDHHLDGWVLWSARISFSSEEIVNENIFSSVENRSSEISFVQAKNIKKGIRNKENNLRTFFFIIQK